jgi:hypothetical protein
MLMSYKPLKNKNMKKVLIALMALSFSVGAMAQSKMSDSKMKMSDGPMMKDGKMMMMKGGNSMMMDKDMKMKNGTMVMADGHYKMKHHKMMMMKEGECFDMNGKMHKSMMKKM